MNHLTILKQLEKLANPQIAEKKRNRGSLAKNAYGIMVKDLRKMAQEIGMDHALALKLYDSGIHEAKKLASIIDEPTQVTESQMEKWLKQFDSWDICDICCSSLFVKTPFAYKKVFEWCKRENEYEKRAAFTLMAHLVFHDKASNDKKFEKFFPIIKQESTDERNFVKNEEKYNQYIDIVSPIVKKHGGRYHVRGENIRSLGSWNPERVANLKFKI